jgi:SAM-dependent methyltransferase
MPDPTRFFDTRAAYLMFVTTTDEKIVAAERIGRELDSIQPTQPGLRVFDAGMGDASLLSHLMRRMHGVFPHIPWLVVGKEISIEDVRQALGRMPERFIEHPELVWVITNLRFEDAVRLDAAGGDIVWRDVALEGDTSLAFAEQIRMLVPALADDWAVTTSTRTGNPVYRRPTVLVLSRADRRFALDAVIPRPGGHPLQFDLVIASQAYRAATPVERKVRMVIAPLARALAPGGRLIGIQAHGDDPAEEIVRSLWPEFEPFPHTRHDILAEARRQLRDRSDLIYPDLEDTDSHLRYRLHAMPSESAEHIGTSTVLAAWNAAAYVAQIDDARLTEALADNRYATATREVMDRHGEISFIDESFVVARSPSPAR